MRLKSFKESGTAAATAVASVVFGLVCHVWTDESLLRSKLLRVLPVCSENESNLFILCVRIYVHSVSP